MNLKFAIRAAFAAGAFVAVPVIAADTFTTLDKNNDGNIDAAEAAALPWLQQGFAQFDTDHNGKLGKDEFAAASSSPSAASRPAAAGANAYADIEPAFYSLDKNRDGNIDQAEAAAVPWLQQSFSRVDHDRDGKLGKDEFAEAARSQSTAALGTSAAAGGSAAAGTSFDSLDKNNDGNIDSAEAAAAPWLLQGFAQYDTDHNSKLGKDEFRAALSSQPTASVPAAAGGTASAAMSFDSLDRNNDGNIDRTEAAAVPWLQQNFSQFDHDRDAKLGKDEFREAQNAQPK